ncbi:MAG: hypothetical protein WKF73_02285 [Nocardioidaceae bacterium]
MLADLVVARSSPGQLRRANDAARFNKYSTGNLVLRPVQQRPPSFAARWRSVRSLSPLLARSWLSAPTPSQVRRRIVGKAGFTGELDLAVVGLDGATPVQGTVRPGRVQFRSTRSSCRQGTAVARFDLNAERRRRRPGPLHRRRGQTWWLSSATGCGGRAGHAATALPAASYDVYVDGFTVDSMGGANYTYTGWVVPKGDTGQPHGPDPDPVQVTVGEPFQLHRRMRPVSPSDPALLRLRELRRPLVSARTSRSTSTAAQPSALQRPSPGASPGAAAVAVRLGCHTSSVSCSEVVPRDAKGGTS